MPLRWFLFTLCFASLSTVLHAASPLASKEAPEEKEGMIAIFNGSNLTGWEGDPRLWTLKDGVIHGETTEENKTNGNTFLIWRDGKVKDFELRLSYRCNATNNSGIQYRSTRITDTSAKNQWVVRGYQFELRNQNKFPDVSGFIYDEGGGRKRLCLVGEQASAKPDGTKEVHNKFLNQSEFQNLMKIDDWNDVVIIGEGNRILHYLNGQLILDFTDEHPELARSEGIIALQLHGGKPMWAEFKDIRYRDLNPPKKNKPKDKK